MFCDPPLAHNYTLLFAFFLSSLLFFMRLRKKKTSTAFYLKSLSLILCLGCLWTVLSSSIQRTIDYGNPQTSLWYVVETHRRIGRIKKILAKTKEDTGLLPDNEKGLRQIGPWSWWEEGIDLRRDADGNFFSFTREGDSYRISTIGCDRLPYTRDDIEYISSTDSFLQNGKNVQK